MSRAQFDTPQQAEAAFYQAFEAGNLEAMMEVWADDEGIQCIHPMGARLTGRRAVEEGWRRVFAGSGAMRFRISDATYIPEQDLSVHIVHENIVVDGREGEGESVVIATNIYRRTEAGWRIVLHHASVAPSQGTRREAAEETPKVVH